MIITLMPHSMSLDGPASDAMDDAVRADVSKGIHVSVAAGNAGIDACSRSPARVSQAYVGIIILILGTVMQI